MNPVIVNKRLQRFYRQYRKSLAGDSGDVILRIRNKVVTTTKILRERDFSSRVEYDNFMTNVEDFLGDITREVRKRMPGVLDGEDSIAGGRSQAESAGWPRVPTLEDLEKPMNAQELLDTLKRRRETIAQTDWPEQKGIDALGQVLDLKRAEADLINQP